MFTDAGAKKANITYLENTSCEVQVRPGGKTWTIYGSPVSRNPCPSTNFDLIEVTTVAARVLELGLQLLSRC